MLCAIPYAEYAVLVVPSLCSASGSTHPAGLRGTVDARTGSGSLGADALLSRDVTAKTGSGSPQPDFAVPPHRVSVGVGSGSARVVVPGGHYRVTGSTGSGSRRVDPGLQDATAAATTDASSGSGSVSAGCP